MGEEEGMGPRVREDTGWEYANNGKGREDTGRERRGWLWGAIDSSLRFATFRMTCGGRCAWNDMWEC